MGNTLAKHGTHRRELPRAHAARSIQACRDELHQRSEARGKRCRKALQGSPGQKLWQEKTTRTRQGSQWCRAAENGEPRSEQVQRKEQASGPMGPSGMVIGVW